ncbi:MAG: hypothetical protein GXO39_04230 [Thermotogae bacterium]|nr:hypothetical protein [Thermotogota bacterium]
MAYIKPDVIINQEVRTASPVLAAPDQKAVIIGPAYHFVENSYAGENTGDQLQIPEWIPGIRLTEITVILRNALRPLVTVSNVTLYKGQDFYSDSNTDFISLGVQPGNVVRIGAFETTITSVEQNSIYFSDSIPADITGDLTVYQIVDHQLSEQEFNVDEANGKISISPNGVEGGEVYITYTAIRSDLANRIFEVNGTADVEILFGKIDRKNPLAYALAKAIAATTVKIYALPVKSDDPIGYGEALNFLKAVDAYFVVPLNDSPSVLSLFPSHVMEMSSPEVKKWRVAILPTEYGEETVLYEGTAESISNGVLYDAEARFLGEIDPNYSVYVKIGDAYYKVSKVITNQKLELTPYPMDAQNVSYQLVLRLESKFDFKYYYIQANEGYKGYNGRIVRVLPSYVEDDDGEYIPSYYAAAIVAAMASGQVPHRPLTGMAVPGIAATPQTNGTLFDEADLNELAEAGYFILTQDNISSAPYIRHQLTTDSTSDYTRELSAVRTMDFLSTVFEKALKPYIGRTNLTEEVIALVRDTVRATGELLKGYRLPLIGAPLLDYEIERVAKVTETSLAVDLKVRIPMPLNWIYLTLVV